MVNCSHCGKEVKRLVFFSPSHKVIYHRNIKQILKPGDASKYAGLSKDKVVEEYEEYEKRMYPTFNESKKLAVIAEKKNIKLCKHGSMIGLCKHNCTK